MTSYPFERVWHHGRGIIFSKTDQCLGEASALCGIPRMMHMTAADEVLVDEKTLDLIDEDSGDDADSFTTAPESHGDILAETNNLAPITEEADPTEVIADEIQIPELSAPMPPSTSLQFNVCKDAFLASQAAVEGSNESFWSYKLYRGPPDAEGNATRVTVHYCTSKETMERVCQYFVDEDVLGFDMEWRPNTTRASGAKDNCSLIQIASPSRIALFHISMFQTTEEQGLVTATFKRIMEDPAVSKAGVNVRGDCTRLRTYLGINTRGAFELSHMYKLVRYSATRADLVNKRLVALATQVKECLGLPMFKGQDVRASDWSRRLNMSQIYYSASDAYAGLQIFHVLDEMRKAMEPSPPRPYHLELNLPIRLKEPPAPKLEVAGTTDNGYVRANTNAIATPQESPGYPVLDMVVDTANAGAVDADHDHDVKQ